jgi:hypothetical protein
MIWSMKETRTCRSLKNLISVLTPSKMAVSNDNDFNTSREPVDTGRYAAASKAATGGKIKIHGHGMEASIDGKMSESLLSQHFACFKTPTRIVMALLSFGAEEGIKKWPISGTPRKYDQWRAKSSESNSEG